VPELKVAIDARLQTGVAGGVESVIRGLATGLSRLEGGDERYMFLSYDDSREWLEPSIGGACSMLSAGPSPMSTQASRSRSLAKRAMPRLYGAVKSMPVIARIRLPSIAPSDGRVERAGAAVVHFPIQGAFATTIPSIYHPHDLQHVHLPQFFSPRQRAIREKAYSFFCHQAATVAVTSSWSRQDIIEHYGLDPEKVKVLPWAPIVTEYPEPSPTDLEALRARYGLPERFIFYPAQTWPHKNHMALLEALALLRRDRGTVVPFVSSGFQNEYFSKLKHREDQLGLSDQTHWLGFVTPLELQSLYRLATAVVVPTRFEAASGPVWEAFVAGTPVACSTVTSLPQQAGDAAILFDPDDIPEIADAIGRLWTEEGLRNLLVERGRAMVAPFSWDLTARLFRAEYRRIAGQSLTPEDLALLATKWPI
jgi:glycosyltransferase involved in cell wall biosynthesis